MTCFSAAGVAATAAVNCTDCWQGGFAPDEICCQAGGSFIVRGCTVRFRALRLGVRARLKGVVCVASPEASLKKELHSAVHEVVGLCLLHERSQV